MVDEKIVGCALSIIVNYDDVKNDHTYAQVTGKETFNTHNPKGNILTVSRCLSIRNTADCAWHAVCTNTARKSAKH